MEKSRKVTLKAKPNRTPRSHSKGIINHSMLSQWVRNRRGEATYRTAAEESGISASTLCRTESGQKPDLETYIMLCRWMECSLEQFVRPGV